jgi:hypothetical protein
MDEARGSRFVFAAGDAARPASLQCVCEGVCSGVPPLANDVQMGYPFEQVGPY